MRILIIAGVVCGVSTAIVAFLMRVTVNEALPEEEQLSWFYPRTSVSTLCRAYDRIYPDNYMTAVLRSLYYGCMAIGTAALVASFLEKRP